MEERDDQYSKDSLRLLGLDVGDRRIGVAVSDPTGLIASPVQIYRRREYSRDVQHVIDLARDYEANAIVVGLPVNMNGTEGAQAEKTRIFAAALKAEGLDVRLWDERLSTVEAGRRLSEQPGRKRRLPQYLDAEAASVILQSYLESVRGWT